MSSGPSSSLLAEALDAHGGMDHWRQFVSLSATVVTGGKFWGMKNVEQDADPRHVIVNIQSERVSLKPFGAPDWSLVFIPERIAIENSGGDVIAERQDSRASFAGHEKGTSWDPLHRAYFSGYALWTYLTAPFVLAEPDFEISEIPSLNIDGETCRGLRARYPERIATHSTQQDFYFGPDGLLRRHDYHVDVAGGFAAAHLVYDYVEAQGLRFPIRRRAYQRLDDLSPRFHPLMVSIDLSEFILR